MRKTALSLAITLGLAGAAMAQDASQTTDYTNRHGDSVSVTKQGQNGNGTSQKTVTGPNGQTVTENKSVTSGNGSATVDKSVTSPNGNTASTSKSV